MTMVFFLGLVSGCTPAMKKEDIFAQAKHIKEKVIVPQAEEDVKTIVSAMSPLGTQEKLVYKAKFFGFPIGEFIIINKGRTLLNGQAVYCFELTVHTLPFFGVIKDRYVSYMDVDKLVVMRHEEYLKKGQHLESAVDFNYEKGIAFYKNFINGQEKEVVIPEKIHDIVTGGFYLRMVPLELGDTTELNVYADERIYNYIGLLHSQKNGNFSGHGRQDALLLKSYLFHDGKPIKNISAEVFLTKSTYRTPLRAILKTLFGNVVVILIEK